MRNTCSITYTTLKAMLLGLACLAVSGLFVRSAFAISLKQESVVRSEHIMLGDIFEGLPGDQKRVMGVAPKPGEQVVLDARTLMRIALALNLPWRPISAADQVTIKRSGTIIDSAAIEDALRAHITSEGVDGQYQLAVVNSGLSAITLPETANASVKVTQFSMRPDGRSFDATIAAPDIATPAVTRQVSGTIERIVSVPVVSENITRGAIIGKNDISFIDMPARSVKSDVITDETAIIGATPRRMLVAGEPVRKVDIEAPKLIERGQSVTVIYAAGGLNLTVKGKALESGAEGDQVRVLNVTSNKTLDAIVTAAQEVTVNAL